MPLFIRKRCDTRQTLASSRLAHLHGCCFVLPLLGNPFWPSSHGSSQTAHGPRMIRGFSCSYTPLSARQSGVRAAGAALRSAPAGQPGRPGRHARGGRVCRRSAARWGTALLCAAACCLSPMCTQGSEAGHGPTSLQSTRTGSHTLQLAVCRAYDALHASALPSMLVYDGAMVLALPSEDSRRLLVIPLRAKRSTFELFASSGLLAAQSACTTLLSNTVWPALLIDCELFL